MQDNKEELRNFLTRSIFFICILVFPSIIGLVIVAPILVQIIPKYGKWAPALLPLGLVATNTIFAAITTQLTNLLNAIGQIKTTFKLMIMWTALTWLLVPVAAIKFGVVGVAGAYSIIGASSLIAIYIVRKKVYFSLIDSAGKPLAGAAIMGVFVWVLRNYLPVNAISVAILIGLGLVVYVGAMILIVGPTFLEDIKKSFKTLMVRK
jgi:O-antigen/teichoic acid export membrane protein